MVQYYKQINFPIVTFITQKGAYPIVPRQNGSQSFPKSGYTNFYNDLVSFQTSNNMTDDLPACSITLGDLEAWDTIIMPNDYIRIDMQYRGNGFSSEADKTITTTIYCGLVSNVTKTLDSSGNMRTYTVTAQGMAKVLNNVNLSTFSELTSNLSAYQFIPDDAKQGIKFTNSTSGGIIYQVLRRFILGTSIDSNGNITNVKDKKSYDLTNSSDAKDKDKDTKQSDAKSDEDKEDYTVGNLMYSYDEEDGSEIPLSNLLKVNIQENTDEAFTSPSYNQFSNYNGTILQMVKDIASRPFNEMFWTCDNGIDTLNYRITPFDEQRWEQLPTITLDTSSIIAEQTAVADDEQYSIFKIKASDKLGSTNIADITATLYPLTNLELIRKYGYKTMEVTADYFNGGNSKETNGTQGSSSGAATGTTEQMAKLHYPTYENIMDVFAYVNGESTSSQYMTIPQQYGGLSLYNTIANMLEQQLPRDKFIEEATGASSIITRDKADQLYTMYQGNSGGKSNQKITRTAYLSVIAPYYQPTSPQVSKNAKYLKSVQKMKEHPKYAAEELMEELNGTIGSAQAYYIIKTVVANNGKISQQQYNDILNKYKYNDQVEGVNSVKDGGLGSVPALFRTYTEKLFNWYADNSKYHSGTITTFGTAGIAIGKRLYIQDKRDGVLWEYYIEGVSHTYSYTQGWLTSITVTRGLPLRNKDDKRRFTPPYSFSGLYTQFKGGYFGERSMQDSITAAEQAENSGGSSGGTGQGLAKIAGDLNGYFHYALSSMRTHFMKGGKSVNDLKSKEDLDKNGYADCSSFVWLCSKIAGNKVPDNVGWVTSSMESDAKGAHKWFKAVDKGKSGDVVVVNLNGGSGGNGHTAILKEDWKGDSTQVINCTGWKGTVCEGSFHDMFLSLIQGGASPVFCSPVK